MNLAMLLVALLSLAATVAGLHCEDENLPNDPEFCQNNARTLLQKIAMCSEDENVAVCFKTCSVSAECDDKDQGH